MPLPTTSLVRICDEIREFLESYTPPPATPPVEWDVNVTIGAPGANLAASNSENTLNLFFYRFEPFGFDADALPGDVQWMRVFCVITAFGVDEESNDGDQVELSAGFNELRILSQVMRLFQEQPVMLIHDTDAGESWHTQFIPRPLADDQINQIWSTQGDTIYRPSIVYEIALAPIEPETRSGQSARVASIGTQASADMNQQHAPWPSDRETLFPGVPPVTVDTGNPQWAPAIVMLTGVAGDRQVSLTLNLEVPAAGGGAADFSSFPTVDIWLAGDGAVSSLAFVGQLLQNPDVDQNAGHWQDIDAITGQTPDALKLDTQNPPDPAPGLFTLGQTHWTGIDANNNSWQLQLFAERYIRFDPAARTWVDTTAETAEMRIRSNPVLITLTREVS